MREYSVPAPFTIGEGDNVVSSVYDHERDDPDYVILQRLVEVMMGKRLRMALRMNPSSAELVTR